MNKSYLLALAGGLSLWGVMPANAALLGDTVTVSNTLEGIPFEAPVDVTVSDDLELSQFGGIWDIDVRAESIFFSTNIDPVIFPDPGNLLFNDTYELTDLDWLASESGSIVGVTLETTGDFDIAPISSFTEDSVSITFPAGTNLASDPLLGGTALEVDLEFQTSLSAEPSLVPEPSVILGLVGIFSFVCFRKRG